MRLPDDQHSQPPPNPIALRYVTEIQPCPEVAIPKVSTHSATPNARLATARAARPTSQHLSSVTAGQWTGAPAHSGGTTRSRGYSLCKLNMPPGATLCRTVSATPPSLRPCRPSSISILMNSPPSSHRADTVVIDGHMAGAPPGTARNIQRVAFTPLDEDQGGMRRNNRQW
jgi:hypothetical protein